MTLTGWKRERRIRKVLAGLARQRVAVVLQPGHVPIIELALVRTNDVEACLMRGWIEPLHENMPMGDLDFDRLAAGLPPFTRTETIYRLTEGGWNALNRAHAWTAVGVLIAIVALIFSIAVAR